jgi:cytochrome c-type biogenesis protein CcmE
MIIELYVSQHVLSQFQAGELEEGGQRGRLAGLVIHGVVNRGLKLAESVRADGGQLAILGLVAGLFVGVEFRGAGQ